MISETYKGMMLYADIATIQSGICSIDFLPVVCEDASQLG